MHVHNQERSNTQNVASSTYHKLFLAAIYFLAFCIMTIVSTLANLLYNKLFMLAIQYVVLTSCLNLHRPNWTAASYLMTILVVLFYHSLSSQNLHSMLHCLHTPCTRHACVILCQLILISFKVSILVTKIRHARFSNKQD